MVSEREKERERLCFTTTIKWSLDRRSTNVFVFFIVCMSYM